MTYFRKESHLIRDKVFRISNRKPLSKDNVEKISKDVNEEISTKTKKGLQDAKVENKESIEESKSQINKNKEVEKFGLSIDFDFKTIINEEVE